MTFNFRIVTSEGNEEVHSIEASSIADAAVRIQRAWANCIAVWEVF